MRKLAIFTILLAIIFVFNPPIVLADENLFFTEDFNSTHRINDINSRVKIENGKVFVADDAVASRVESKSIASSYYGINRVSLGAAQDTPGDSRIVYFISNNGGNIWNWVQPNNTSYNLPAGNGDLRWAAVLSRSSAGISPSIEAVTINFYTNNPYLTNSGNTNSSSFLLDFYSDVSFSVAKILGFGSSAGAASYAGNASNNISYILPQTYSAPLNSQNNLLVGMSGNESTIYKNTRLLRLNGSADIYYITEGGLKRKIPSPEIFNSYNDKWGNVAVVNWEVLGKYPDNIYIFLEKGKKPKRTYKINNGKKILVSEAEIKRLGIKDTEITPVNKTEFNYYK